MRNTNSSNSIEIHLQPILEFDWPIEHKSTFIVGNRENFVWLKSRPPPLISVPRIFHIPWCLLKETRQSFGLSLYPFRRCHFNRTFTIPVRSRYRGVCVRICMCRGGGGGWSKFRKINSEIEGSTVLRTFRPELWIFMRSGPAREDATTCLPRPHDTFIFL